MNEKGLVVQSNYLIENRPRMTKDETRLFLSILSTVKRDDEAFRLYKISVKEFADLWGLDNKSAYTQIKEALIGLNGKTFVIEGVNPETNKSKFFSASYIASAAYEEGEGYAEVEISEKFKPYLLELKEQYTKYFLKNVIKLKGVHSIRTYELLKQYEKLSIREFEVGQYKKMLGIEKKYDLNADLKKRVLEPAKEEINANTDLLIDYKINGRGKKAVIEFHITTKKIILQIDEGSDESEELACINIATQVLKEYDTDKTAEEYITWLKTVINLEKADNKIIYLQSCIRNKNNAENFLDQFAMDLEAMQKRAKALEAAEAFERQELQEVAEKVKRRKATMNG